MWNVKLPTSRSVWNCAPKAGARANVTEAALKNVIIGYSCVVWFPSNENASKNQTVAMAVQKRERDRFPSTYDVSKLFVKLFPELFVPHFEPQSKVG